MKKILSTLLVLALLLPCGAGAAENKPTPQPKTQCETAAVGFAFGVHIGLQLDAIFQRFLQGLEDGDFDQPELPNPPPSPEDGEGQPETNPDSAGQLRPAGWPYNPPPKPDLSPPPRR